MPIYEYICSDCRHKFELLRAMSQSDEEALCPSCGNSAQRKPSVFCRSSDGLLDFTGGGGGGCSTCSSGSCSSCHM